MDIGKNIKKMREERNLTQADLGKIAGVSDKAVSTWENGVAWPRLEAINRMADYFGIRAIDIIGGSESDMLTSDERSLIDLYRALDSDAKYLLLSKASSLKQNGV